MLFQFLQVGSQPVSEIINVDKHSLDGFNTPVQVFSLLFADLQCEI